MVKTSTVSADYTYVPVTFREKNGNEQDSRKKVVYDVPIGTKIKLTNASYEIRNDGIYRTEIKDGKPIKSQKIREIDLPTFDMAALNTINTERTDVARNTNQRIDDKDLKALQSKRKPELTFANALNDKLVKNSDFRVLNSGSVSAVQCNAQNVSIDFAPKDNLWHPTKSFALILPKKANG